VYNFCVIYLLPAIVCEHIPVFDQLFFAYIIQHYGSCSSLYVIVNCFHQVCCKVLLQESPTDARVTRDCRHSRMAAVPRWPSAAILDIIEPDIAPFDPPTPKTLT